MRRTSDGEKRLGLAALNEGIRRFLLTHTNMEAYDGELTTKIGRFILTLTSITPTIPLEGKHFRDISPKQRVLFQANTYEGTTDGEFIGNRIDMPKTYFIFSKRTMSVATGTLAAPCSVHKTLARLCHERTDPVIAYEKLAMVVPWFVKDMQGRRKYMSVDEQYRFENAYQPSRNGVWVKTAPIQLLLSILDHQDVHIHRGKRFIAIYNRWFGLYCGGE